MNSLTIMMKPSSGMCNLNCSYCFYNDEAANREQASFGMMSEKTLKNVIRRTIQVPDRAITYAFQGGEPTLRGLDFYKKAVELQKQYNQKQIPVTNAFQTNGILLDEAWCEFFAENHFLLGISIDGIADTHDCYRISKKGEPTYRKVLDSINLLERYGVDFNILTVIQKQTAAHLEEIYHFYGEKGWKYQQYILCLDPIGAQAGSSPYTLTPEEYGEFLIHLFRLYYEDWKQGKQPYIREMENWIGLYAGIRPEACAQRGTCDILNMVEADGSVYPCDFYGLDAFRIGNFNTERYSQIDQNRAESGFIEASCQIPEECKCCAHYRICRCGCRRNRNTRTKDALINDYCEGYKLFFTACRNEMLEMASRIALS